MANTFKGSVAALILASLHQPALADPLPSWEAGETKQRIIAFVEKVTDPDSPDFVPEAQRIATFDNDGALWAEKPTYFQLIYAMDKLAEKAENDPDILTSDVLKAAATGDLDAVHAAGAAGMFEVVKASHQMISVEEFQADVRNWLETRLHPETGKPMLMHVYQPAIELLRYLRDEDFQVFIVSGGGLHFIRAFAEDIYGVPPQNVVGTTGESSYEVIDGKPVLIKQPGIAFIDDGAGKPIGIDRRIGRRPVLAYGNSDGDFPMLEYTTSGQGARLGILIHHSDEEREWAYDRQSVSGRLDKGLDQGPERGWVIVDMKRDWSRVFP